MDRQEGGCVLVATGEQDQQEPTKAGQEAREVAADAYVETEDLSMQDDGLHLTAAGARVLGERLAEAVWRMPSFKRILASCLPPHPSDSGGA
jgi:hypothetical protein